MLQCSQFHLETAKKRAQQRMREGRAKPIDALAINLFLMEEFDVNMTAPYSVFIGLALDEVEELCDDIKGYQVRKEGMLVSWICTANKKCRVVSASLFGSCRAVLSRLVGGKREGGAVTCSNAYHAYRP